MSLLFLLKIKKDGIICNKYLVFFNIVPKHKYRILHFFEIMLNTSTNSGHKLQPGELAGKVFTSLISSSIISASKLDMPYLNKSLRTSTYSEVPGYREYKVALVIAPNYDYHWYRQDADGGWSHKRGLTAIDFRDASGNSIRNPQTADRNYGNGLNYSTWGGWYIIKY
ncbi:hypothetical protein P5G61_13600 [Paenibacillus sp. F6_3S_P_1C]|uniref:Uncharacterized protein n=1 Tax=Paenibacillus vandeheii TaxID=3035917 RepID=A0ABT8JDJ6_9BACL|nr:hypothetical protein [Paenibacillus vandeheii]MDN4602264.1 hypothetical protein [Paenibacillus vandeheii]